MAKLWGQSKLHPQAERFLSEGNLAADQMLVKYDCLTTLAHAKMLARLKILSKRELGAIKKQLSKIIQLDKASKFKLKLEDEDVHTAIENYLMKKLGKTGAKIHIGRSRNDQIICTLRLYYKEKLLELMGKCKRLSAALHKTSKTHSKTAMPGYTHMQKAMPSTFGLWLGAFAEAFDDDALLLQSAFDLIDQSPLGSAAGYGSTITYDKGYAGEQLGFSKVQNNSLYVQNSRGKFELFMLATLGQLALDVNKFACDLMLFSTEEFGFIELSSSLCTGSSIMPHKKNPDVLELMRAKSALLASNYGLLQSVLLGLPSGYNRDFQETKKPAMESLSLAAELLEVGTVVITKIIPNKEKMKAAITPEMHTAKRAADLAKKKNIPFREAYFEIKQEAG